jgi:hypothetical protein
VDEVDACLVPLLDPKEIELLHPQLDHHEAAVREVVRLAWLEALAILKRRVERQDPEGDVPFTTYLNRMEYPLPFARGWWDHLCEAHYELLPLSITTFAVSAYAVAAGHALMGEHVEARRWARVGAETTEFEDRSGLSLVVYVRASKLLAPLLHRIPRP